MKHLKKVLVWYGYAVTYTVAVLLLFAILPEQQVYNVISGGQSEIDSAIWDNAFMSIVLVSALFINGIIIFTVSVGLSKFNRH